VQRSLSSAELNRQPSLCGLDLVHFIFALATQGLFQPGCFVVGVVGVCFGGRGPAQGFSYGGKAFVEEAGVLSIVGRLLSDLGGDGTWLRDRDQLSGVRDEHGTREGATV
jgi:hypothetical protein